MSKLRVLVLSANYGAGHVKAAEAIIEALYAKETDAQIAHVDFSEFLGKPLDSLIKNTYLEMIKHTPKLWGEFYYRTSRIEADSLLQRFLNGLGKREFVKFILSYRPDVIICTYPVIAGVLAQLKLKQIINVPLATVVTDYAVHNQWIHQGVDLYLVGCQEVLKGLVSRGVNPSRIKVTGIPVHPKFSTKLDKQALLNKFGLVSGLPTFLVMGGAYGVLGEVKRICEVLASAPTPVQTLVVCGKDQKLFKSLNELVATASNPMKPFGFVNNVEEFMTVADLVITKAGGLTVSEALTKGLPLIIHKPIPGQELENTNFVKKIGAGIETNTLEQMENTLHDILNNPKQLQEISMAARRATPSCSAERTVDYILSLVHNNQSIEWGGRYA